MQYYCEIPYSQLLGLRFEDFLKPEYVLVLIVNDNREN